MHVFFFFLLRNLIQPLFNISTIKINLMEKNDDLYFEPDSGFTKMDAQ